MVSDVGAAMLGITVPRLRTEEAIASFHQQPKWPTFRNAPDPASGARREAEETTMSDDFLKNPLSLFDVGGKTAIVTGASGAFGALASKVLAGAGANLVLASGHAAGR